MEHHNVNSNTYRVGFLTKSNEIPKRRLIFMVHIGDGAEYKDVTQLVGEIERYLENVESSIHGVNESLEKVIRKLDEMPDVLKSIKVRTYPPQPKP